MTLLSPDLGPVFLNKIDRDKKKSQIALGMNNL
jgi:hypothetical protein